MVSPSSVRRTLGVLAFTVVEVATLGAWFASVDAVRPVWVAGVAGAGVLVVGLTAEGVLTDATVTGLGTTTPLGGLAVVGLLEAGVWIAWLLVAASVGGVPGVVAAGVFLAAALVLVHTLEQDVVGRRPFRPRIPGRDVAAVSLVEAAGASVWLGFVLAGRTLASVAPGTLSWLAVPGSALDPAAVLGLAAFGAFLAVEHAMCVRSFRA